VAVVYSSVTVKIAIMSILREFGLSAYKKPETSFYIKFYNDVCPFKISEFQVVWSFTGQGNCLSKKTAKIRLLNSRILVIFSGLP